MRSIVNRHHILLLAVFIIGCFEHQPILVAQSPTGLTRTTLGTLSATNPAILALLAPELDNSTTKIIPVASNGSTKSITVFCNIAWKAFSQDSWISVADSQPTGITTGVPRNASLTLTVKPNTSSVERTGSFKLLSDTLPDNFAFNQIFTISQAAALSTTSVQAQNILTQPSVYPNPANDVITMAIYAPQSEMATVRVCTMLGSIATEVLVTINAGENHVMLPITEIPAGAYFLEARSASRSWQFPFIKQ